MLLVDSDEEEEFEDRSVQIVYKYALASQIVAQYEASKESFKEGTLKRELADELMDMIESEYFAGALYELCTATFKSTILGYLCSQLSKNMSHASDKKQKSTTLKVPQSSGAASG